MVEIYKIQKGDCPWNLAVKELKSRGEKVTNGAIAAEMKRLAQLNGCKDVDDFGTFFKIGVEIKRNNTEQNRTEQATLHVTGTKLIGANQTQTHAIFHNQIRFLKHIMRQTTVFSI